MVSVLIIYTYLSLLIVLAYQQIKRYKENHPAIVGGQVPVGIPPSITAELSVGPAPIEAIEEKNREKYSRCGRCDSVILGNGCVCTSYSQSDLNYSDSGFNSSSSYDSSDGW